MAKGAPLLHQLAPETGARRLLLRHLDKAETAAGRLVAGDDGEALHDFRVALRRFRAAERAYRPWLDEVISKKLRKRLKAVVQRTGPARDAEVQLAWLQQQRVGLRPAHMAGFRWLCRRIEERQRDAAQMLREELPSDFSLLAGRLGACLRLPCRPTEDRFGRATGERLKPMVADLAANLGSIGRIDGMRHVHPARLLCKRVRYLLEPVAEAIEGGAALTGELSELQDLLGEINDARVLGEALAEAAAAAGAAQVRARIDAAVQQVGGRRAGDPRPGLLALAERLAEKQRDGLAGLQQRHQHGTDEALLGRLGAAVSGLLGP